MAAWLCRACAIAINIVGIPMVLSALGPSRFSLLLVILSIGSWIGFANIGVGRVIANVVARSKTTARRFSIEIVSLSTLFAAVFNVCLFIVATTLFFTTMSLVTLDETIAANYQEFVISIVSLFGAMSLWFFLSVFEGIDAGRHRLYRLYNFQLLSYLISFVVLLVVFPTWPSIWLAAALLNFGFLIGSILHATDVFRRNRQLFSSSVSWRPRVIRHLMFGTLDFTIISLGIGITYQLVPGLLGFVYGPESVIELGIFMRLFQSYGALLLAFTYSLSNIVASHLKARETDEAIRTVRLSLLLLLFGSTVGACLFFFAGNWLLSLWLHTTVSLDFLFRAGAAFLIISVALHFFISAVLVATGDTRSPAYVQLGEAVAFLPLAYIAYRIEGQSGIFLAMDVSILAGIVIMLKNLRRHAAFRTLF
jgi:O-antigen/teichoic acid export membrane protein